MYYAIKTLEARIAQLVEEHKRVSIILEEPELIQDLEWAANDLENIDLQLQQLRGAIRKLL